MSENTMNNTTRKGMNIHARRTIAYFVLILLSFLCLIWFYILFINATRSNAGLKTGFTVVPGGFLVQNFTNMIKGTVPVLNGMLNSLIVAASSAALCVYFSCMTAFSIHAYSYVGRKAFFTFILMVMMIPTQVTALGFISFMNKLKLMDTFVPLILPAIAAPVVFFYMKQYMDSNLPLSLLEAARIDGCSEPQIFNRIVLPLMKPAIAVEAIFSFVSSWNNYFTPALILSTDKKKTLPILIAQLRSADWLKFDMGVVYVTIAFSIFPVIVVYLILSKSIVGGVTAGGVKE